MAKINQEQTRDFEYIYYKDLGRALDKATTVALSGPTTLNIGTGVIVTSRRSRGHGREIIAEAAGRNHSGDQTASKQPMVVTKAKQVLGWEAEYNLEAGFKDYIEELKALSSPGR